MCRVKLSPTKSTIITSTDIGPSKIFKKMEPNAERLVKILDVIAYLFVGTIVTIMCRVKSSPTKSTIITSTDIGPSKIFKKMEPNAERLVKILDVIAYLFVGTIVTIVYRVVSPLTKSTTLAFIDIGSLQNFQKNGTARRKAHRILIMQESIFSLACL
jgi:hypothetical protein